LALLFAKLNGYLKCTEVTAQAMKIEAAELHKVLVQSLQSAADVVIEYYWEPSKEALNATMKDKVPRVQKAASEAMNEWEKLKEMCERQREKKSGGEESRISGVWGSAARAAKFLKKNNGSGGGNFLGRVMKDTRLSSNKVEERFANIVKQEMKKHKEEITKIAEDEELNKVVTEEKLTDDIILMSIEEHEDQPVKEEEQEKEESKVIPLKNINVDQTVKEYYEEPPNEQIIFEPELVDTKVIAQEIENTVRGHDTVVDDTMNYEQEIPDTTAKWIETTQKLKTGDKEESYKTILSTKDDLYLFRLMMQTGSVPNELSTSTTESVLKRSSQIIKSSAITQLLLQLIENSISTGKFFQFSRETQNELLDTLHSLSNQKNAIGEIACNSYRNAITKIHQFS